MILKPMMQCRQPITFLPKLFTCQNTEVLKNVFSLTVCCCLDWLAPADDLQTLFVAKLVIFDHLYQFHF